MAKIVRVTTNNVGGLGDIICEPAGESIVIRGPNASGKTKLISSIVYGITGEMSVGLNSEKSSELGLGHLSHIDTISKEKTRKDKTTTVELELEVPGHDNFTVSRTSDSPNNPIVNPDNDITRDILRRFSALPETALFRQNVLNFVIAEPENRAVWLESAVSKAEITTKRKDYKFALTRAKANVVTTRELLDDLTDTIRKDFEIPESNEITDEVVLAKVNIYREMLNLAPLDAISANSNFLEGMDDKQQHLMTNRGIILIGLRRFTRFLQNTSELAKDAVNAHLSAISELKKDSNLRLWPVIKKFVDDVESLDKEGNCPISADILKNGNSLLNQFSTDSTYLASQKSWESIYANAETLIHDIDKAISQISKTARALDRIGEDSCSQILKDWCLDLENLKDLLRDPKAVVGLEERLLDNWLGVPSGLESQFELLITSVKGKSIESIVEDSIRFLNNANLNFRRYSETKLELVQANKEVSEAMTKFVNYCKNTDPELNAIYKEVTVDFNKYYSFIFNNKTDSEEAVAILETHEGKLDFKLEFHGRGKFSPDILHSEGDKHVIGICMYLAVLKHVSGNEVDLILMDDVLTSIDADNRGKFCKMLKVFFKDTQFIFTTHDRIFANQIRNSGLVSGKNELRFYGWDIETGPKTYIVSDWKTRIKELLEIGDTEEAAHKLRYNLEGIFFYLACDLGAKVKLQPGLKFAIGDLKDGVIQRVNSIIAMANRATKNTVNKQDSELKIVKKFSDRFKQCKSYSSDEQWLINDSVHFNPDHVSADELREAVTAYIELLDCLWCDECQSWLQIYKSNSNESFQCNCKKSYLNLH